MRRVGSNNDPGILANSSGGLWPKDRGLLLSDLLANLLLADPPGQGGAEGFPEQPEPFHTLRPGRPARKVGAGRGEGLLGSHVRLSLPKKSASLTPSDRRWASECGP